MNEEEDYIRHMQNYFKADDQEYANYHKYQAKNFMLERENDK